ncbi:hypothetical protein L4C34_13200 [Vibrio profundum]|uniref:PA3496 family putative envelope integrity protein n=1 Tax=Vibrio profundum TaxID=2910247 RepID=UPI003D116A5F
MSINSIQRDEMEDITYAGDHMEETATPARTSKAVRSAQARRRIEMLQEIKESGLTVEEARELGLLH